MKNDGELTIEVNGAVLVGWKEVRVTRGAERVPNDFDIAISENTGRIIETHVAYPGQICKVRIGDDVVVTGFIDRYCPTITPRSHEVRLIGRGKCQDLVDCSAWLRQEANQVNNATTERVAKLLCDPFGIEVDARDGPGGLIPQFNVILTETPWDIIERVARHSAFLAYEGADGRLVLARGGKQKMASGVMQGVNLESASAVGSIDQRYSFYEAVISPLENLTDVGGALAGYLNPNSRVSVKDETVGVSAPEEGKRFRPRIIVSDAVNILDAERELLWERNRRNGRAASLRVLVDSWRDTAGRLWEPNTLVPVHVPALRIVEQEWLIGEVTYIRGAEGTHADLVLMPPAAYEPRPIVLQPFDKQVADALAQSDALRAGGANRRSGTGGGV